MKTRMIAAGLIVMATALTVYWLTPTGVQAHCDTLDGPVVKAARAALAKGDVTPVLQWVKVENEAELRTAFNKTLLARSKGDDLRDFADNYFFETLVRLHRAGEGAPYDGLKPAGTDLGPAITGADKALEQGSVDTLVKLVTSQVEQGIRQRFAQAAEKQKHAGASVAAGREFVAAYVEYVHYVERLDTNARSPAADHAAHAKPVAETTGHAPAAHDHGAANQPGSAPQH